MAHSKQQLRKAIQHLLNLSMAADRRGDYSLSLQLADDAYFLSLELQDLKGS